MHNGPSQSHCIKSDGRIDLDTKGQYMMLLLTLTYDELFVYLE